MKTIYKYPLLPKETNELLLRGKVLSVGVQGDEIMVWAVHDDDEPPRDVWIHVMGTGHDFVPASEDDFIGTVFLHALVFHVFATYGGDDV